MVRYENPEFEKEILEGGSCLAVPVEVSLLADGAMDMLVYSFCREIAEEFPARYGTDPFSAEAVSYLMGWLSPKMAELGYTLTDPRNHAYLEFRCDAPNKAKILPDCEIIDTLDGEKWDELELDEFMLDPADPTDRMAVIRRKGRIVCYAGLNDLSEEDGLFELTVECEEAYRKQGFGASCVAALAGYLMNLGEGVKYVTAEDNLPSHRTAASAGFTLYKKVLPFVCQKDAAEEGIEF